MEFDLERASERRALSASRSSAADRRRRLDVMAWVVLLLSLLLSLWFGLTSWQQAQASAEARFSAHANTVGTALVTHMNAYEDTVRSAAAVLEAHADIDRDGFRAFVEKLRIPSRPAGVHGLGFARHIAGDALTAYERERQADYGPDFHVYPAGVRSEYVVIDLIYPERRGMLSLLGKDVFSEPQRRAAMELARDTGQLTSAARVSLTDSSRGQPGLPGFLLYAPVYATPLPADANLHTRRDALRGYASAGFGWSRVMEEAMGESEAAAFDVHLVSIDKRGQTQTIYERTPLVERYGRDARPAFQHSVPIRFLGNSWELRMSSPPARVAIPGLLPILGLTAAGIAFGLLLFFLLRNVARTDRRSRALLDAVADHLPALIAYLDKDGCYGFANRATREWFASGNAWTGRDIDEVHAADPHLLAELKRAMREGSAEHATVWETSLGRPERSVQVHLVPDVETDHSIAGWYLMITDNSEQKQTQRELAMARDHLQRVTDKLPALIAQYDRNQRAVFFNRACADFVIWQQPYRAGIHIRELFGEERYAKRKPFIEAVLAGRDVDFETTFPTPDGPRRMHTYYTPDVDEAGAVVGFFVMSIDISEKARLENALFDANARAEVTLSSINEAVITADVDAKVNYMNPAAEAISGWRLEDARGLPLDVVVPVRPGRESVAEEGNPALAVVAGDLELTRQDGHRIVVERSLSPLYDRAETAIGSVMVLRDITEARVLSARMAYLAHHDSLTALPNRLQLNETLAQLIAKATHLGTGVAVLFIDLDLFKHVNDALGHHIGDQLLQQVARRIQRNIGNLGSVYRTGGDEFVVLLDHVVTRDSVAQVAERLLAIAGTPYSVASHELHQAFSIGVSLFPEDGYDASTLMMRADAAMYLAKRNGRNAFRFYTHELASSVDARIELESALRRSLRNGDLTLFYQPQIDRATGNVVGVEGLVRWRRGERMMLPGEFLPIAEETNLIVDIDQWAIREACRQSRQWQQAGLPPIRVSVNVAAANFDTDSLVDTVTTALHESGLPPDMLELEVTETTLMRDVQRTDRILRALKALGVRIAIDDFGTGFSSLSYLGNYGFNVLKIDQSFVRDVTEPNQGAITRAIIGLAGQLQCRTVAEGVESEAQLAWLVANGCDELQGNLFSTPMPANDFAEMMAKHPHWPMPEPPRGMHMHWS